MPCNVDPVLPDIIQNSSNANKEHRSWVVDLISAPTQPDTAEDCNGPITKKPGNLRQANSNKCQGYHSFILAR